MDIGFIGLGNIGQRMAHWLTVFDTRREAVDSLVACGAADAAPVIVGLAVHDHVFAALPASCQEIGLTGRP